MKKLNITLIGTGNVAHWFAWKYIRQGYAIRQVYSPNKAHACDLADLYHAQAIDQLSLLEQDNDLYLFSLCDDAYLEVLQQFPFRPKLAVHTAGSVAMDIFADYVENYGVIYPCQTILKKTDFQELDVPLCVEGNNTETEMLLMDMARILSPYVQRMDSRQRQYLHLAAVFVSNFTNALYHIGTDILRERNIAIDMLYPLLQQTVCKLKTMNPQQAQTGPAVRGDENILLKQSNLIEDENIRKLYLIMSEIIKKHK